MDDLTPRHFRVLAMAVTGVLSFTEDGGPFLDTVAPHEVSARLGMRSEVVQQCLVNLLGAGPCED